MPIVAPVPGLNYDSVNSVLNTARMRWNDNIETLSPIGGRILGNTHAFSQTAVNAAWRKAQEYLGEKGYDRLIDECIISQFPVVSSVDPATQCWINWQGCFDGNNFFEQPALPQFFNHPLKIWERWSGQNAAFSEPPMQKMLNGLPSEMKTTKMRFWEWRSDTLYTPGSQMSEDLRIRHVSYLADFSDVGNIPWFQQPVPIMRCSDGLAWLICAELVKPEEEGLRDIFTGNGEGALSRMFNLDVQADQQVNIQRQPRSGRIGRRWY